MLSCHLFHLYQEKYEREVKDALARELMYAERETILDKVIQMLDFLLCKRAYLLPPLWFLNSELCFLTVYLYLHLLYSLLISISYESLQCFATRENFLYTRRLLFQLHYIFFVFQFVDLDIPCESFYISWLSCYWSNILLNHVQELNREKAKAAAALKSLQEKMEEKHKLELQEKVSVYFSRWNVIIYL